MWWIFLCLILLCGCSSEHEESVEEPPIEIVEEECVRLSDVDVPVWDSGYAVLSNGDSYVVDWGISSEGIWFSEHSSFPGFGRPMLIVGVKCSEEIIGLQTGYGYFEYVIEKRETAYWDSESSNAVRASGEEIVNFAIGEELLYVLDREQCELVTARLQKGTKIIA